MRNKEVQSRVSSAVMNYLLRNPFFERILRDQLIGPVLYKLWGEGTISGWIMRILEFKSSLAYTI
jgi:hypothetical protein